MPTKKTSEHFNPGVTIDVVIFTVENAELKALFIERAGDPFKGAYALPGGFVHRGETSLQTAERILHDKAGVTNVYIEQLYTFDAPDRDPRGQVFTVSYFALVPREKIKIEKHGMTEHPEFISLHKLPTLAFDHKKILSYAHTRLANKLLYTNIAYSLLPKLFTLTELQKTYEIILDKKLDKRNFRKKYLQLNLLEASNEKSSGGRQRPALLYSFSKNSIQELEKFF
jgi:8-oxo-dGTP diphosphatase